jgi:alanine racemase
MPIAQAGLHRRAVVDLDAIVANARRVFLELENLTADLRADAYGHGSLQVGSALLDAGVRGVVVSRTAERERLVSAGYSPAAVTLSAIGLDADPRALSLYGIGADDLEPSMRLSGEIVSIKTVRAGSGVSYGYTYRTERDSRLVLVSLGFADGVPRGASNRAPVRIGDFVGRVTGRVAMDQFVVDVGVHPARLGDDAILFGDGSAGDPTLTEWANIVGLAPARVLSQLGTRIVRCYAALRSKE